MFQGKDTKKDCAVHQAVQFTMVWEKEKVSLYLLQNITCLFVKIDKAYTILVFSRLRNEKKSGEHFNVPLNTVHRLSRKVDCCAWSSSYILHKNWYSSRSSDVQTSYVFSCMESRNIFLRHLRSASSFIYFSFVIYFSKGAYFSFSSWTVSL